MNIRSTFTNSDLVSGVLTITHNLSLSAPYQVKMVICDNTNKEIIPDNVTGLANSVQIDLSSYGVLVGTYGYLLIA